MVLCLAIAALTFSDVASMTRAEAAAREFDYYGATDCRLASVVPGHGGKACTERRTGKAGD